MVTKKDTKEINETKTEKKEMKNIYLVNYYIKDLMLNKIIETNLPEKAKGYDKVVLFKGEKPILEGMGNLFPKVEETIKTLKDNEEKTLKLTAVDSYGLRNKELVRVVPMTSFKQNKINPFVGLVIQAENMYGVVKSISGGRVLVDFNSPHADHETEVYVKKIKTLNDNEKIDIVLKTFFAKTNAKLKSYENKKITIEMKMPETTTKEMYTQIFEGFFKNYVEYKEIAIENIK